MTVSILTSLFYFGAALGSMITGKVGDMAGRKPALILSSGILIVISFLFYIKGKYKIYFYLLFCNFLVCQNSFQMGVLRFLYGFSYGFSIPLPSSMMSEIMPL